MFNTFFGVDVYDYQFHSAGQVSLFKGGDGGFAFSCRATAK
jgi:hypothetical protein